MKQSSLATIILAALAVAGAARATVYNFALTVSEPAAGLTTHANGVDTFGNVAVDNAGGNLAFDITINSGWELRAAPDSNHWDFAFNTAKAFTYSGITFLGGGAATETESTNVNASPFGSFTNAIECDRGTSGRHATPCLPGWSPGVNPIELKFTAIGLKFSDLKQTTTPYGGKLTWFITDLVNAAGKTGNVAAQDCTPSTGGACDFSGGGDVPEPATWALLIMGLGGVGAAVRSRRRLPAEA